MNPAAVQAVSQPKLEKLLWITSLASWGLLILGFAATHFLHLRAVDLGMPASTRADLLARHVGEAVHVPGLALGLVGLVSPPTPYAARCLAMLAAMFNCLFVFVLFKGWTLL